MTSGGDKQVGEVEEEVINRTGGVAIGIGPRLQVKPPVMYSFGGA